MKRIVFSCVVLGLLGCGRSHEETSQAVVQRTQAATASGKTSVVKSSSIQHSKVKPPPPVDPEEPPYVQSPRQPVALQKEVEAYLKEPPIVVTAAKLVKDYQNEAAANERYQERKVWITGYVRDTARGVLATPYVKLEPGKAGSGAVVCFFEKGHSVAVEDLKENQEVTIEGRVSAKTGNEVRVAECRILTPAEVQSITAAARQRQGK